MKSTTRQPSSPRAILVPVLLLCTACGGPVAGAESSRESEHRLALDGASHVRLEHLAGPVHVGTHDGDEVVVRLVAHAREESAAQARRLAQAVELHRERAGDALAIRAVPPLGDNRTLFYVPPGAGAGFNRRVRFAGQEVTVRGDTRWGRPGTAVHVALRVELPRGVGLDLTQHAGPVQVRGLQAPVRARLHGDKLQVSDVEAPLDIESGNGTVQITGHRGPARVTTGSADMNLRDAQGGPYRLRSGSGLIRLREVAGSVSVETGSGGVSATAFRGGERLSIAGSSGDVEMQGDFSAVRELRITVSSGDIELRPTGAVHAQLEVESVRGAITVELPGQAQVRDNRNRYSAVAGEGLGQWKLESRTGRIRIVSDSEGTQMRDLFGDDDRADPR